MGLEHEFAAAQSSKSSSCISHHEQLVQQADNIHAGSVVRLLRRLKKEIKIGWLLMRLPCYSLQCYRWCGSQQKMNGCGCHQGSYLHSELAPAWIINIFEECVQWGHSISRILTFFMGKISPWTPFDGSFCCSPLRKNSLAWTHSSNAPFAALFVFAVWCVPNYPNQAN